MYPQNTPNGQALPASIPPQRSSIVESPVFTGPIRQFSLGDALTAGGGLLVFVFSFLPFVTYDKDIIEMLKRSNNATWFNAWATETFLAPLTWFVSLGALALLGLVTIRYFSGNQRRIGSFSISQIEIVTTLFISVVLFSYATASKSFIFGSEWANQSAPEYSDGVRLAVGGYLMIAFSIVALVGAFLVTSRSGPILFPQQSTFPYVPAGPAENYLPPLVADRLEIQDPEPNVVLTSHTPEADVEGPNAHQNVKQ